MYVQSASQALKFGVRSWISKLMSQVNFSRAQVDIKCRSLKNQFLAHEYFHVTEANIHHNTFIPRLSKLGNQDILMYVRASNWLYNLLRFLPIYLTQLFKKDYNLFWIWQVFTVRLKSNFLRFLAYFWRFLGEIFAMDFSQGLTSCYVKISDFKVGF